MNSRNTGGTCNSSRNAFSQKWRRRHFCYLGNKLWGENRRLCTHRIQLQLKMAKVKQVRDKCERSIVCEGRWAVQTLINSLLCWYKPLLRSHYILPLDIWSSAFSCETLTEYAVLNLHLSVCRIRNWGDSSEPWLPRYRGAIDLEGRAHSLTVSLEFKQLCNKVVFINLIVNDCIPIPLWGGRGLFPY